MVDKKIKKKPSLQKRALRGVRIPPVVLNTYLREIGQAYLRAPSYSEEERLLERVLALAAERHGYKDDGGEVIRLLTEEYDRDGLPEDRTGLNKN